VFVPSTKEIKLATVTGAFLYSNINTILPFEVSKFTNNPSLEFVFVIGFVIGFEIGFDFFGEDIDSIFPL